MDDQAPAWDAPLTDKKPHQWLEKTNLKDSTEARIMAAQEQALTNRLQQNILTSTWCPSARLGLGTPL